MPLVGGFRRVCLVSKALSDKPLFRSILSTTRRIVSKLLDSSLPSSTMRATPLPALTARRSIAYSEYTASFPALWNSVVGGRQPSSASTPARENSWPGVGRRSGWKGGKMCRNMVYVCTSSPACRPSRLSRCAPSPPPNGGFWLEWFERLYWTRAGLSLPLEGEENDNKVVQGVADGQLRRGS